MISETSGISFSSEKKLCFWVKLNNSEFEVNH